MHEHKISALYFKRISVMCEIAGILVGINVSEKH